MARRDNSSTAIPSNTPIQFCPARSLTSPHDGYTLTSSHGPMPGRDVHPSARDTSRRGSAMVADEGHRYHTQPNTPREDHRAPTQQYFEQVPRGPIPSDQRAHGQDLRDPRDPRDPRDSRDSRDSRDPRHKMMRTLEQDRTVVGEFTRAVKDMQTTVQHAFKRNRNTERDEQWLDQTSVYNEQRQQRVDPTRDPYFQLAQRSEELKSCQIKLKESQTDISDLQAAFNEAQNRVDQMKDLVDHMQSTLDNKESFLGSQINDEDLQRRFNTLMFEIKTWSGRFNNGTVSPFKEDRLSEYQYIIPRCADIRHLDKITADKKRKRLFVRGWTAYIMCTRLFRDLDPTSASYLGVDVWLDEALADDFRSMEDRFWLTDRKVIPHKTFNDWRALTAELLIKAIDDKSDELNVRVEAVVTKALSEVMELVKAWHAPIPGTDLRAEEDKLRGTFIRAVQFARDLRRQRALWSIRFPTKPEIGSLEFDPATMQDVRDVRDDKDEDDVDLEELRNFQVELVVTPTLYKRGTMNGEWFEREEAVRDCLAKVAISALR